MDETRSVKISAMLTPTLAGRLDAYRERHRWSRSAAISALIEEGLARELEKGKDHEDQETPGRSRHRSGGTVRGSSDRGGNG